MKYTLLWLAGVSLLLASCGSRLEKKEKAHQNQDVNIETSKESIKPPHKPAQKPVDYVDIKDDSTRKALMEQGRIIAARTQRALGKELKSAIKSGGLEYAVAYCNTKAMPLTDSMSTTYHVDIRRLAKKFRNPENETNKVESEIFKNYVLAYIEKRPMYEGLSPDNSGHPVYYRPIKVDNLCLSCHGKPGEHIPNQLATKIASLYPDDKAINFELGQPRGMWAITFKDYKVAQD